MTRNGFLFFLFFGFFFVSNPVLDAEELLRPIPRKLNYNREMALLGRDLFFDPILSRDRSISCSSCHDPYSGGDDNRRVSKGIQGQLGGMNSPTVLNSYFNFRQFWNGRSADLQEQAKGPIHNPVEMGMDARAVERRLNRHPDYQKDFYRVFQTRQINFLQVTRAIAEFEKALYTPNAPFDLYLRGEAELTPMQDRGYLLFKRFGCINCHNGINIGGNSYQKIGVIHPYEHEKGVDDRYKVTGQEYDRNVFKVPTLRNIENTAPYFHDGSAKNLKEAIKTMAFHNLGQTLSDREIRAIIAFLRSLTGELPSILKEK